MAATEITAASQNIAGNFDLAIRGNATAPGTPIILHKALGAGGVNFIPYMKFGGQGSRFVENTGTNAYKLAALVAGVVVEFNQ